MSKQYKEIFFEKIIFLKEKIGLLIVTATDIETEIVHSALNPFPGYEEILKSCKIANTFFVGVCGNYGVVHVQVGMGTASRGSSLSAITETIIEWEPKAVLMIGIAFGINESEQQIGDVIISESIIPYDSRKISADQVIYRGAHPQAGQILLNRFKNERNWEFILPTGEKAKMIPGPLLTGEVLIDNIEFRDQLKNAFPTAVGGEMEGGGLHVASEQRKIEWIIVKGICDFADGNKSKNKKDNQIIAATAAMSLCQKILMNEFSLLDLDIKTISSQANFTKPVYDKELFRNILFDVYNEKCERFYLLRGADEDIDNVISFGSVWISGDCGCGKTNIILRNLIVSKKEYRFIDLSPCVMSTVNSLIYYIYIDLHEYCKCKNDIISNDSDSSIIIKNIVKILENYNKTGNFYIIIDEIPISSESEFEDFLTKIIAISIACSNSSRIDQLLLIASSLYNPLNLLKQCQQKAHEKIKFLNLSYWSNDDIEKLLLIITSELNLTFDKIQLSKIVESSSGSPRYIKKFIRNYISCNENNIIFDKIIDDTKRELTC